MDDKQLSGQSQEPYKPEGPVNAAINLTSPIWIDLARVDLVKELQHDESLEDDRGQDDLIGGLVVLILEIEDIISFKLKVKEILSKEEKQKVHYDLV